jgi:hypothetical protein
MTMSALIAPAVTILFVLGLVAYRLLWAASSVASAAALGRASKLPKSWRRWLLGEHNNAAK